MKVNFRQAWLNLLKAGEANKPQVLTGIGISLMVAAVPLAVVGTVQACRKIKDKKKDLAMELKVNSGDPDTVVDEDSIEISTKEIVKTSWKYYIPTILSLGTGAFCIIASTKEGLKRTAAMAAAYQLSESAYNEYRNATKEVVGDKKENEVQTKIMRDRMELMTDDEGHVINIYDTRDGAQLCFDYWSGRYFYSDVDYIRSQINRVNENMLRESMAFDGFATLNDVYTAIGLPRTGAAEDLVWRLKDEGLIELKSSTYMTVDDRPCWVLAFNKPPRHLPTWMMDRM